MERQVHFSDLELRDRETRLHSRAGRGSVSAVSVKGNHVLEPSWPRQLRGMLHRPHRG